MNKDKLKSMATNLFQKSKEKFWSFGNSAKTATPKTSNEEAPVEELKEEPLTLSSSQIAIEEPQIS